jgi:hypothetical protein
LLVSPWSTSSSFVSEKCDDLLLTIFHLRSRYAVVASLRPL